MDALLAWKEAEAADELSFVNQPLPTEVFVRALP